MRAITALLVCVALALTLVGCKGVETPDPVEGDLRQTIIEENLTDTGEDSECGGKWISRYQGLSSVYEESFRTPYLSEGFELCFSKWTTEQGVPYIVSEAVYADGKRLLCDIYELTAVDRVNRISYALERIASDPRLEGGIRTELSNAYPEGVGEYNITELVPQTLRYSLLGNQSIASGKLLFGTKGTGNGYSVRVRAEVSADGIGHVITCNESVGDTSLQTYLMNKSFFVGFSPYTGEFAAIDRQYQETVLYESVDTLDESRRMPMLYYVYADRVAVYTVESTTGTVAYGLYDAATKKNYVYEDGSYPLAVNGNRLYFSYPSGVGTYSIGFRSLDDPSLPIVTLGGVSATQTATAGVSAVSFSEDERQIVLVSQRTDGVSEINVHNADTGAKEQSYEIAGRLCTPRYAGFLADGSIMVLCEKKLLCDEYLFIIKAGEEV